MPTHEHMRTPRKNIKGFSLFEILIYTGIIAIVGTLFSGVLITITKVQNRQSSSTEVNQQLMFSMQGIQRYIRKTIHTDAATGTPVSILTLRMASSEQDPTIISITDNELRVQEGVGSQVALTSDNVIVDNVQFTKVASGPESYSVQIELTISYNTGNPEKQYTRTLSSAVTPLR